MAIVVKIAAVMIACAGLGLATLAQIPGDLRSHAPNGRPQDGRPKWEAFLEGGASYWNDQPTEINALSLSPMDPPYLFTTYVATRPRIFTGVRYWFNPREAVEVSYSSAQFRMTLFSQFQIGGFEESGQAWGVSDFFAINYVRAFRLWNRVQPFLTVGLGGVHFRSTPLNGLYEPHPITINLGGGFDFQIARHWSVRAEDRDWMLEAPRGCAYYTCNMRYSFAGSGMAHNQVPSVGLVYRF